MFTRGYWLIFRSESPWTRRLEDERRREDERRNAQRRERGRGEGLEIVEPFEDSHFDGWILYGYYTDIIWIFSTIKDRGFKYGDIHHHSSIILAIKRGFSLNYGCLSTNSDFNEF